MPLPLIMIVLVISLTGCSLWQSVNDLIVPPRLPLSEPIGPERRILLHMSFDNHDLRQNILVVLELDAYRIAMAGITEAGLSLFNLSYDGKTLLFEQSPLMQDIVSPEMLLNDVQLAFWPSTVLAKQIQVPWRLETEHNKRNLYYNGEKQTTIIYNTNTENWPARLDLINYPNNYHLHIDTISNDTNPSSINPASNDKPKKPTSPTMQ